MAGQMCWLPGIGTGGSKILYLRTASHENWRPYTAFPQFSVPDYREPGGSKGWATYQKLIRAGWMLVPTAEAQQVRFVNTDAEVA